LTRPSSQPITAWPFYIVGCAPAISQRLFTAIIDAFEQDHPPNMATFSIENFGCRATQADASAIAQQLLACGYTLADSHAAADVVVLNTCTVTAAADTQARDAVRHIHRANSAVKIVVTGCYAQRAPEELASLEGVTWVVGNSHQTEIPRIIGQSLSPRAASGFVPLEQLQSSAVSLERGPAKILTGDIFKQTAIALAPIESNLGERTRPTLKIQDGCNSRCAYCVIPFVRGRCRSLAPEIVLDEIRKLARAGAREVVLSGINLGSYGRDLSPRVELLDLLGRVLEETPLEQLRLSSIEPMDITLDLVERVASTGRIARHFHMPLQSGSDRILRAMHRWYRASHYSRRVELIRERLPDAAIGADVIVGFPGETDDDFRATCDFLRALPFTYLHVFSFSPRPGTKAVSMSDQIPLPVIQQRARKLRALSAKKIAAFRASLAGRALRVLTLNRASDAWTEAISGNFVKVRVAGHHPANQWREVCLTRDASQAILAFE
jgi:threonylcarbamoyladenosine tRNA methylthiotransferase MtaB